MKKSILLLVALLAFTSMACSSTDKNSLPPCLESARLEYVNNWNSECNTLGFGSNCILPAYNATRCDNKHENQKDRCYATYGNN